MLIGIDSSPCSLSLRNRSMLCSTEKCHQNKSDSKNVFVQKFFFSISSILSIPIMLFGINGGYFSAICWVCLLLNFESTIVNVCFRFMQKILPDCFFLEHSLDFDFTYRVTFIVLNSLCFALPKLLCSEFKCIGKTKLILSIAIART